MKYSRTAKVAVAALAAIFLSTMMTSAASAGHEGAVYKANLTELNNSGGSGNGTLTVSEDGETMTVQINASGLNLDGPHAMHIHGIVDGDNVSASTCPTMADDANGDGVLTVLEGAPKYGGVQVSLTTAGDTSADSALAVERYPSGTAVNYNRAGIDIPDVLKPNLSKVHFVIHGLDENGNGTLDLDQTERSSLTDDLPREGTAPVLCGTLTVQAGGIIQTGAGGLAETGSDAPATATALLGFAGFALLGGFVLRNRKN